MEVIQNILIVILAGYMTVDQNGPVVLSWFSVIVGMISGLIMGDMNTGLMIGGTFQLMSLGVAALGGASAPNYGLATNYRNVYCRENRNRSRCSDCSRTSGRASGNPVGSSCKNYFKLCRS